MAIHIPNKATAADMAPPADDLFYYGHRIVEVYDDAGNRHYEYHPITQDAFLDPEEGEHFVQGTLHNDDTECLKSIFRHHYRDDPTTGVYSDLKFLWGLKGLSQPCPDVAVVPNLSDRARMRESFDAREEGTRPCLILELTSPRYRNKDLVDKVAIYERAGIQEYIIIDSNRNERDNSVFYEVSGYRLHEGTYHEIEPDERGWIYSATSTTWIGPTDDHSSFQVIDARTGERILPADERAEAEAARAEAEATRASAADERARAEAARASAADERARTEAAARAEAERQAQAMQEELKRLREELARLKG